MILKYIMTKFHPYFHKFYINLTVTLFLYDHWKIITRCTFFRVGVLVVVHLSSRNKRPKIFAYFWFICKLFSYSDFVLFQWIGLKYSSCIEDWSYLKQLFSNRTWLIWVPVYNWKISSQNIWYHQLQHSCVSHWRISFWDDCYYHQNQAFPSR